MKINFRSIPKASKPTMDAGVQVRYDSAKREGYRGRWYMLLALVIAPVLLVLWVFLRPHLFVLAPALITSDPLQVRAPDDGQVVNISTAPGATVKEGDLLLQIEDITITAQIEELEAQLTTLTESGNASRNAILAGMRERITVAEQGLKRQDEFINAFDNYRKRGVVPTADMAAVVQSHTAARMAMEQAKADLLKEQYAQLTEQQAGALTQRRQQLALELARLRALQQRLTIIAPYSTKVTMLSTQVGEKIARNQSLLWLAGRDSPVVVAYLDPRYIDYSHLGQKADVRLPNGNSFRAVIKEPTELVAKVPTQLAGPFDGEKPALKVTLTPIEPITVGVEGLPVEVNFDYLSGPLNWFD